MTEQSVSIAVETEDVKHVLSYLMKHTRTPADGVCILAFCLYAIHTNHAEAGETIDVLIADITGLLRQIDLIMPLDNATH